MKAEGAGDRGEGKAHDDGFGLLEVELRRPEGDEAVERERDQVAARARPGGQRALEGVGDAHHFAPVRRVLSARRQLEGHLARARHLRTRVRAYDHRVHLPPGSRRGQRQYRRTDQEGKHA